MTSSRTSIDWWAFRSKAKLEDVQGALAASFGPLSRRVRYVDREHGWQGYEQSATVCIDDMSVGMLAYGGDNQKGWVYAAVSGKGCSWIEDWDLAQEAAEGLPGYSFRRVDIALTTATRDISHESVLSAYRSGGFSLGGRPPTCKQIIGERPEDGRTIYVGSRERDKFFRGYEKGWELAIPVLAQGLRPTHIDGVPIADIYRLELELKPKTVPLPEDLIERRDQYFAGAYPYLQEVLSEVEPEVLVLRPERGPQLELSRALAHIRKQYGNTLFTAMVAHHGDFGAVWERVCGSEHNRALLDAGVLLVDHE